MTPAQLRAYSAVVRLGSVRAAAQELGVSDAAVSLHVAQLRKELDDSLFSRVSTGLAFTPGGLRLASRAVEILGLQRQTVIEVSEAGHGRRLLRIAASSSFAEHAAPGMIELFAARANDLSVELSVHPTSQFRSLVESRGVDIALGSRIPDVTPAIAVRPFLKYQFIVVGAASVARIREANWFLGPSAGNVDGTTARMLRDLGIPEARQRIFQSDAAAVEEVQRVGGLTLVIGFTVAADLKAGRLVRVEGPGLHRDGEWCAMTLPSHAQQPAVAELLRFINTPRCTQAIIRGSGVGIRRFRPKVHVTLWS
ncbi:MAG TPA: LysR family transcriptional regulator [Aldersonia sp.]